MNNQPNLDPGKTEAERFLRQPKGTLPTNTATVVKRINTLESKVTALENRQNLFIDHWTIASADVLNNKRNNNGVIEQYNGSAWVEVTPSDDEFWYDSVSKELWFRLNGVWVNQPALSEKSIYVNRVDNVQYSWNDTDLVAMTFPLIANTTETITSMFAIGGIASQEIIPSGTTLNQFVKDLLTSTFYPTFVLPTASLAASSISGSGSGAAYEAGATNTLTLTATFNRGSILGKLVSGIWQPATQQDYRAGIVNKYTINGVDNGTSNTMTSVSKVLANGSNSFNSKIDFNEGSQPTDSAGVNYNSKYPAGNQTPSTSIIAYYPQWYGVSATSVIDTYAECSDLTKSISSGTAFSSAFSPSDKYVYFITRNPNGVIKDGNLFSQTISALNVEDGVSEFYKKSFTITLLDGTTTTLYSYRTRTTKTLTSYIYSIT